jgi:SpoVK/Ycf46/Vps4 family AAA+-type ATPase
MMNHVHADRNADFELSRIFRPRLLVRGMEGMGQQYLAAAVLNHFEGYHVQSFDLSTLLSDSTRVRVVVLNDESTADTRSR